MVHIQGFPWWPGIVKAITDVNEKHRDGILRARKDGTTLIYTLGDQKHCWSKTDKLREWDNLLRGEMKSTGISSRWAKIFKKALEEAQGGTSMSDKEDTVKRSDDQAETEVEIQSFEVRLGSIIWSSRAAQQEENVTGPSITAFKTTSENKSAFLSQAVAGVNAELSPAGSGGGGDKLAKKMMELAKSKHAQELQNKKQRSEKVSLF